VKDCSCDGYYKNGVNLFLGSTPDSITRLLLASFILRAIDDRLEEHEWSRFAVNHYRDKGMEDARVECVRLIAVKANGNVRHLDRADRDHLKLMAQALSSSPP
jgi:hypothetical protein